MSAQHQLDHEVIVVGAGPVGMTLAALLGRAGRDVLLLDRFESLYGRPRSAHFDHEIARILASIGLGEALPRFSQAAGEYHWQNASGELLLHLDWHGPGPSGWPTSNNFTQQRLEEELDALVHSLPTVTVRRGEQALAVGDEGEAASVTTSSGGSTRTLRAAYVVGCDGAGSLVRGQVRAPTTDLQFFYDWLICDVVPLEPREWVPTNLQICDPARPTSVISGGPGRRRWEFMRLAGETIEELNRPERAWELLKRWDLHPGNATLERHTVYTFAAQWVDQWRDGRVLLAGDSAHLMPPFAGQGLCSGLRDAANLAWKLVLVLEGRARDTLLDTYSTERLAHVQHAIELSVELGKVICELDPEKVAKRDAFMVANGADPAKVLPPLPPATLGDGLLHKVDGVAVAPAGQLSFQGLAEDLRGRRALLDDLVGTGFRLITVDDPRPHLDERDRAFLREVDAKVVHVVVDASQAGPDDPDVVTVIDVNRTYLPRLRETGDAAVLVRPDFYIFGVVPAITYLSDLVRSLRGQLQGVRVEAPGTLTDKVEPPTATPSADSGAVAAQPGACAAVPAAAM